MVEPNREGSDAYGRNSDDSLRINPRAALDFHQRSIALEQCRSVSCTEAGVTHRPLYHMARLFNTGASLPLTLRQRTHRNTMTFETCKRTTHSIAEERTSASCSPACGRRGFHPHGQKPGAFRRDW